MKKTVLILTALALAVAMAFTGCTLLSGLGGGKSTSTAASKTAKEPDDRDTSWYDPKSKETTFYIANAKQLEGLAKLTNLNKNSVDFEGKTIELTGNIDLGGSNWRPTGSFMGTFDGKGYSISNFSISGYNNAALFGEVVMGQIKNLVVNVDKIETRKSTSADTNAAGLVGYGMGVTIENCGVNIKDSITAYTEKNNQAYAGGLVGSIDGMPAIPGTPLFSSAIINCYVSGNVSAITSANGQGCSGGLVGIVGTALTMKPQINISNSYVVGNVSASSGNENSFAGGFIGCGWLYNADVKNSYVSATVTATVGNTRNEAFFGGIFGRWGGGTNVSVYYNSAKVPSQKINSGTRDGALPTTIIPLADADMKRQASFKDFEFSNVWTISSMNGGYPYLRWQR